MTVTLPGLQKLHAYAAMSMQIFVVKHNQWLSWRPPCSARNRTKNVGKSIYTGNTLLRCKGVIRSCTKQSMQSHFQFWTQCDISLGIWMDEICKKGKQGYGGWSWPSSERREGPPDEESESPRCSWDIHLSSWRKLSVLVHLVALAGDLWARARQQDTDVISLNDYM